MSHKKDALGRVVTLLEKDYHPSVIPKSKVVEITSAAPAPFEYPVRSEKLAELFGWDVEWIREKCRQDAKRNPNPMPSHKPGKYRLFYPSEVNAWVKAA